MNENIPGEGTLYQRKSNGGENRKDGTRFSAPPPGADFVTHVPQLYEREKIVKEATIIANAHNPKYTDMVIESLGIYEGKNPTQQGGGPKKDIYTQPPQAK